MERTWKRYSGGKKFSGGILSDPRLASGTSTGRSADHYTATSRTALREYYEYSNYVFLWIRARTTLTILNRLRVG